MSEVPAGHMCTCAHTEARVIRTNQWHRHALSPPPDLLLQTPLPLPLGTLNFIQMFWFVVLFCELNLISVYFMGSWNSVETTQIVDFC